MRILGNPKGVSIIKAYYLLEQVFIDADFWKSESVVAKTVDNTGDEFSLMRILENPKEYGVSSIDTEVNCQFSLMRFLGNPKTFTSLLNRTPSPSFH